MSHTKRESANFVFWKGMLRDNNVQYFIDQGNNKQKTTIINVLKYLKRIQPKFFERVNGKFILKQLKGEENKVKIY